MGEEADSYRRLLEQTTSRSKTRTEIVYDITWDNILKGDSTATL